MEQQYPAMPAEPSGWSAPAPDHRRGLIVLAILMCTTLALSAGIAIAAATRIDFGQDEAAAAPVGPKHPDQPVRNVLRQRTQPGPARIGGTPVADPCTLLPLDLVTKTGFVTDGERPVSETALTADTPAVDSLQELGCTYSLIPGDGGQVRLEVFRRDLQSRYSLDSHRNRPEGLGGTVLDSTQASGMSITYSRHASITVIDQYDIYMASIANDALVAELSVRDRPSPVLEQRLRTLAPQVAAAIAAPATRNEFGFTEPFTALPDPCAVLTPEDFQTVSGAAAGPVVTREYQPHNQQRTDKGETLYLDSVTARCERRALLPWQSKDPARDFELSAEVTGFATEEMAARAFTDRLTDRNITVVGKAGGSEVFGELTMLPKTVFRVKNLIVGIRFTRSVGDRTDGATAAKANLALAQQMATRLGGR
ncbi:hypothetical protein D5S17_11540 [Pseudonocardiaceae bacterium YIM PH 21723]|nr:hypothetical protein D5S17_11540 [Pseudonocardiaceae bacterium YIM PH 21723]